MKFGTKAIHAGVTPDPTTGAIMTPIFQTSTYVQKSPGEHQGYEYGRTHNPTRSALQKSIAALENGKHGICFSSGLSAIDAVIKLFNPGDEIITTTDLYGGTYRLFIKVFQRYGIKFHFVSIMDAKHLSECVNENTKMIWVETPSNPMMNIIDLEAISAFSREHKLLFAVDNTFASPFLQNPLDFGADLVMHSVTKYLGGHSDVVMGALVVNDDELASKLTFLQNACGAIPGPQDCFLVLRGIKTLHLRMERHCQNGKTIAAYLKNHPIVDKVYWPGFEDHPNHEIAKRQMKDFGGMISFTLVGNQWSDAITVMENLSLFSLAESLGGVESLCGHPATMTHASIPKEDREKIGLVDSLIRLSVGVEDAEDLKNDIAQALAKIIPTLNHQ
jgi:cystathionine gamma-lyase